jgi:flagellar biosynthesis/type III secretory pathway chaperone
VIASILDRLETVLGEETRALTAGISIDVGQFTRRKNQLLLELTSAHRTCNKAELESALAPRARQLKALMQANEKALAIHLEAARQVSQIIVEAMQKAESDGTYAPPWLRMRKQ